MSMRIVTGATGTAHVTSNDDGSINMGIFGSGNGVLKNGNKLAATIVDNNTVKLSDGDIIMQGRVGRVDAGTTEDMTIETGTVGSNRNDLICVRYSMDTNTGYESMSLVVIKGTPSTGSASDPAYNTGDIRTGSALVDFPLYRVKLEGINISGVDKLFTETDNLNSVISTVNTTVNALGDKIGTVPAGETVEGQITTLNENLTTFHYRKVDGVRQVSDDGETWENFSKAPTLVGTYTGNKTIDVSSVLGANDTVDNFIVEIVSYPYNKSAPDTGSGGKHNGVIIYALAPTKTLSGTNLVISGMQAHSALDWTTFVTYHVYSNITYKVWHV